MASQAPHAALTPAHLEQEAYDIGFLPEILELLAAFLVGGDVLQLAHTCQTYRSALASRSVWSWRLTSKPTRLRTTTTTRSVTTPLPRLWCAEQIAYFSSRSLLFHGLDGLPLAPTKRPSIFTRLLSKRETASIDCGDAWELPFMLLPEEDGRLSFDLWFSIREPEASIHHGGGILFGAQSSSCFTPHRTPHHIDRFVHVDPDHNLYCSMLVGKPVVASDLHVDRWYHLALVLDGSRQSVYLDGELINSGMGISRPQDKWHWIRHAQIGTGFIAEGSRGKPTPSFAGWYPFHGLIDDFRMWHDVLTDDQIQQLACGELTKLRPVFQLSTDQSHRHEGVASVKCSRPIERHACLYPMNG